MKIKSLFFAGAVLIASLTGCNKEDGGVPQDQDPAGETSLFIKFNQGNSTRADADEVTDGTAVNFEEGILLFVDGAGVILHNYPITTASSATGEVTIGQLKNGLIFSNIKKESTEVYVFGNYKAAFTSAGKTMPAIVDGTTSITAVTNLVTSLKDQADADYGVVNATLYGQGTIVDAGTTTIGGQNSGALAANAEKEAFFQIFPLISRIELSSLQADPAAAAADKVTKYTLAGIYINNFYYEMSLDGRNMDIIQPYNFLTDHEKYQPLAAGGEYELDWNNILYNTGLSAADTDLKTSPTKAVWAYNTFTHKTTIPHIIFHLTDVEVNSVPYTNNTLDALPGNNPGDNDGIAYLTVAKYMDLTNSLAIDEFERGNIYKIAELLFDGDDLRDLPEVDINNPDPDKVFNVWVEVVMLPWKAVNTGGVFN